MLTDSACPRLLARVLKKPFAAPQWLLKHKAES